MMTDTTTLRINTYGRCALDAQHDQHIIDRGNGTGWDCPGQASDCGNCDGRKCMNCIFRVVHQNCVDDCPSCCGATAAADEDGDSYPTEIVVFCDGCGTERAGDYMVTDNDDSATRLGYARTALAARGWTITITADLCPECAARP
jgi:hypothetical protein